jgi:hypothetical protein
MRCWSIEAAIDWNCYELSRDAPVIALPASTREVLLPFHAGDSITPLLPAGA